MNEVRVQPHDPPGTYAGSRDTPALHKLYGNNTANLWGLGGVRNVIVYTAKVGNKFTAGWVYIFANDKEEQPGTKVGTVYSLNSLAYPADGIANGYWYKKM